MLVQLSPSFPSCDSLQGPLLCHTAVHPAPHRGYFILFFILLVFYFFVAVFFIARILKCLQPFFSPFSSVLINFHSSALLFTNCLGILAFICSFAYTLSIFLFFKILLPLILRSVHLVIFFPPSAIICTFPHFLVPVCHLQFAVLFFLICFCLLL